MNDDKAAAAYHPFSSAEEMHEALKPRDEIAQAQVDGRELLSGVDLSLLPQKPLSELGQGDLVYHEGVWCKLEEYQVSDQGGFIRLRMVHAEADPDAPTWSRHIIASSYEKFYTPVPAEGRAATRRRPRHPDLVRRVPEGH